MHTLDTMFFRFHPGSYGNKKYRIQVSDNVASYFGEGVTVASFYSQFGLFAHKEKYTFQNGPRISANKRTLHLDSFDVKFVDGDLKDHMNQPQKLECYISKNNVNYIRISFDMFVFFQLFVDLFETVINIIFIISISIMNANIRSINRFTVYLL